MRNVMLVGFMVSISVGLPVMGVSDVDTLRLPETGEPLTALLPETRSQTFPSGLRLIVERTSIQRGTVAFTMLIGSGSTDDPDGKEGMAHLVEHLWFRSRHSTSPPVWQVLGQLGTTYNGFTTPDSTIYVTVGMPDTAPALHRLELLRLEEPLANITEQDLNAARRVVLSEAALRREHGAGEWTYDLYGALFPAGHPYHDAAASSVESLQRITLEDVKSFVKQHYRPDNTTLLVSGDLSPADFQSWEYPMTLVQRPSSPLPAPIPRAPAPPDPGFQALAPAVPGAFTTHRASLDQPILVMGWRMPSAYSRWGLAAQWYVEELDDVVRHAVSTSRRQLFGRLRPQMTAGCRWVPLKLGSMAVCSVGLGGVEDARALRRKVLRKAKIRRSPEEWARFLAVRQRNLKFGIMTERALASPVSWAPGVASLTHFSEGSSSIARLGQWASEVKASDMAEIAERFMGSERHAAVLLEPDEENIPPLEVSGQPEAQPSGPLLEAMVTKDRLTPEMIRSSMVTLDLSNLKTVTLPNGLKAVMVPARFPFTMVAMIIRGGTLLESQPGLSRFSSLFSEAPLLNRTFDSADRYGNLVDTGDSLVSFAAGPIPEVGLHLLSLRRSVDEIVTTFKPGFRELRALERDAELNGEQPWNSLKSASLERLFPGSPMTRYNVWNSSIVKALKDCPRTALNQWNQRVIQPANTVLLIVGPFKPASAEKDLNTYFKGWTSSAAVREPMPLPPPPPAPGERIVHLVDRPSSSQAQIQLSCQVGPHSLENHEALEVLSETLEQYLWSQLREQLGISYTPTSSLQVFAGGTALLQLRASVMLSAGGQAIRTMLDAIDQVHQKKVEQGFIRLMQVQIAQRATTNVYSPLQVLDRLIEPLRLGVGWELITGHAARLAEVKAEDLSRVIERCQGHEAISVLGSRATLVPQLEVLKLPYETLDLKTASRIP